ncbi:DUF3780 domain-containing protein [Roseibacillus persicicus]|uniref:DUF3780 domain-containing protein n=1 Tax=Roseibacillus persicicus TaxID=454148 RepID=UPI00280D7675|nr:DUF3780 domain-containing protein [Roseibacillus persicicus]MDQ8191939.1 DUF3780 domain-containing protein [Roseibacillus persicicus]
MRENPPETPPFGVVDPDGEHGVLTSGTGAPRCQLTLVARTERGFPRHELAAIPMATWRQLATVVQKELARGMDPEELGSKAPVFRAGEQALSPLVTRELAVLFWALMEDGQGTHIDALLTGWRQLAREERWWLYARASNPSQQQGRGWRRALYFALTDPADTRTAPRMLDIMDAADAQKKSLDSKRKVDYRDRLTKKTSRKKTAQTSPKKTAAKKVTKKAAAKKTAKKASAKPASTSTKTKPSPPPPPPPRAKKKTASLKKAAPRKTSKSPSNKTTTKKATSRPTRP